MSRRSPVVNSVLSSLGIDELNKGDEFHVTARNLYKQKMNSEKCYRFAKASHDAGCHSGTSLMGELLWDGWGIGKDQDKAKQLFKESATKGDLYGQLNYARHNLIESQDINSQKKGLRIIELLINKKFLPAMLYAETLFRNGIEDVVQIDSDKANKIKQDYIETSKSLGITISNSFASTKSKLKESPENKKESTDEKIILTKLLQAIRDKDENIAGEVLTKHNKMMMRYNNTCHKGDNENRSEEGTFFTLAIQFDNSEKIIKLFINKLKVDTYLENENRDLPLHLAAKKNRIDILQILSENRLFARKINQKNKLGLTALEEAMQTQSVKSVKFLAPHSLEDKNGTDTKALMSFAQNIGNQEIIIILQKYIPQVVNDDSLKAFDKKNEKSGSSQISQTSQTASPVNLDKKKVLTQNAILVKSLKNKLPNQKSSDNVENKGVKNPNQLTRISTQLPEQLETVKHSELDKLLKELINDGSTFKQIENRYKLACLLKNDPSLLSEIQKSGYQIVNLELLAFIQNELKSKSTQQRDCSVEEKITETRSSNVAKFLEEFGQKTDTSFIRLEKKYKLIYALKNNPPLILEIIAAEHHIKDPDLLTFIAYELEPSICEDLNNGKLEPYQKVMNRLFSGPQFFENLNNLTSHHLQNAFFPEIQEIIQSNYFAIFETCLKDKLANLSSGKNNFNIFQSIVLAMCAYSRMVDSPSSDFISEVRSGFLKQALATETAQMLGITKVTDKSIIYLGDFVNHSLRNGLFKERQQVKSSQSTTGSNNLFQSK